MASKKSTKIRKQESRFRLRSFFCKRCNIHYQHFGSDPVEGVCHCCKREIASLPLESDHFIVTKKEVEDLMP